MQYGRRASRCTAYYSRPRVHFIIRDVSRERSRGSRSVPHPSPFFFTIAAFS